MSRIGKLKIAIPNGVTIDIKGSTVTVKGSKGELKREFHPKMKIVTEGSEVWVERPNNSKEAKSLHGLSRTLLANMVIGVTEGFQKKLEIIGVGYRAQTNKNRITLTLGYSHPVEYKASEQIEFKQDEEQKNVIIISGIDKELVGQTAAIVRSFRKPEPYKGKGIRYSGEYIARKAGKAAASK